MRYLIFISVLLTILGCNFQTTPWDSNIDNYDLPKDLTAKNRDKLLALWNSKECRDSIKIAIISDTHIHHNQLSIAVEYINSRSDVDLVLHGGDMTESGLLIEYDWFIDRMDRLDIPWFAVIGNHDCLNHGIGIYKDIFGKDYFNINLIREDSSYYNIVAFNDNSLEINPNNQYYEKMVEHLTTSIDNGDRNANVDLLLAHHSPESEHYFTEEEADMFKRSISDAGYEFFIYGHTHSLHLPEKDSLGVIYFGESNIGCGEISIITIYDKKSGSEEVEFRYERVVL